MRTWPVDAARYTLADMQTELVAIVAVPPLILACEPAKLLFEQEERKTQKARACADKERAERRNTQFLRNAATN